MFSQKVHNTVCVNLVFFNVFIVPQKVKAFTVSFHISITIFKVSKLLSPLRLVSFGRKRKLVTIDLGEKRFKRFVFKGYWDEMRYYISVTGKSSTLTDNKLGLSLL